MGFHQPCRRLGVEKGDELRVTGVNRAVGTVTLDAADGRTAALEALGKDRARAGVLGQKGSGQTHARGRQDNGRDDAGSE